jgi:hypothetical protein
MIPLLDGSVPATGSAAMASQQEKRDVFGVRDTHASHTHNWLPRWDLVGRLGRRRPRYAQDPVPRGVSGGGRCCTAFVPSERETWSVQSQVRGVTASEIGHSARRRAVDGLPDRSQHTPYWDPRAFAPQLAAVNDIAPAARNAIGHCRLSCRTCHPPAPRDRLPGWTASWPYTGSVTHTATRPGRRTSGSPGAVATTPCARSGPARSRDRRTQPSRLRRLSGARLPRRRAPVEPGDLDELARLLIRADLGDLDAAAALYEGYRAEHRLHLGDTVVRLSPYGRPPVRERLDR